ncbi:hypothetical protein [Asticcacaulis sp. YBE204]|uniref:hypothetical protein n=1 Tax=Asticcacaulis sp. YBE204 TaxID=1282363 RepID=UPI0003C3DA92|nr:hypothetical protein [Asticcacaulis sp. YBE204]ESQ79903.1 hypothetical protein AEYBE204_08635 [Asticcacaulis sp. YBE204]
MQTKFKMFAIAAIATVSASALTVPAMAAGQYDRHDRREDVRDRRDNQVDARIDRLEDRLDQGRRSGRLSRAEFVRLNSELNGIDNLSRQYERSGRGIDSREMANLDYRLDRFETKLRWERNDRDYGMRR